MVRVVGTNTSPTCTCLYAGAWTCLLWSGADGDKHLNRTETSSRTSWLTVPLWCRGEEWWWGPIRASTSILGRVHNAGPVFCHWTSPWRLLGFPKTGSHQDARADLKLTKLLPQYPQPQIIERNLLWSTSSWIMTQGLTISSLSWGTKASSSSLTILTWPTSSHMAWYLSSVLAPVSESGWQLFPCLILTQNS